MEGTLGIRARFRASAIAVIGLAALVTAAPSLL
jgi:hypothetical protein